MQLTVAKVGGSLFDLPDLRDRLGQWAATLPGPVLFVPGGGDGVNVIRGFDRLYGLGEEKSHWLALRVLTINAQILGLLLGAEVVPDATLASPVTILDPYQFCLADEGRPGALPHGWRVTSDAIAARMAEFASAELVLLKSVDLPRNTDWAAAARAGLVDETVDAIVRRSNVPVQWVNLRQLPVAPR